METRGELYTIVINGRSHIGVVIEVTSTVIVVAYTVTENGKPRVRRAHVQVKANGEQEVETVSA